MINITDLLLLAILLTVAVGVLEHSPTASRLRRKPKSIAQKLMNKFLTRRKDHDR
jgi:hypothetical protein